MALYGPGFEDGWLLLVMLVLASAFLGIGTISSNALFGMNRPWTGLLVIIVWSIVFLGITASFLGRYGVYALAAAFFISHLVRAVLASIIVLKNIHFARTQNRSAPASVE